MLAAPTPTQRAERLLREGDTARDQGKYQEAADKYRSAYYSLPPVERISYVGALAVRNAMTAFELLHDDKPDPAVLERQIVFVKEFLASVEADKGGADKVGAPVIEELQQARTRAEEKLPPPPSPPTKECPSAAEPEPDVDSSHTEPKQDDEKNRPTDTRGAATPPPPDERRPHWLGIGLAAGGGVTAGIGAGVLAGWWTVRREASNFASLAPGFEEGTQARASYLAQQEEKAQAFRISGAVLVSVGAATAAGGVVLLLLDRRGRAKKGMEARTTLVPRFDRHGLGVTLGRRF